MRNGPVHGAAMSPITRPMAKAPLKPTPPTVELPSTRTRTLVQGLDGNLYTANDDGEIWRVVPK